jgi:hypothetical protein
MEVVLLPQLRIMEHIFAFECTTKVSERLLGVFLADSIMSLEITLRLHSTVSTQTEAA